VHDALSRLFEPVLRPIRKIMPDTGQIDFAPMVFMLLLVGVSRLLQAAVY
jgi:YggT family protein